MSHTKGNSFHAPVFASFSAAIFATLLTNLNIESRSWKLDLALLIGSISLCGLLMIWKLAEDNRTLGEKNENAILTANFVFVLGGFGSIALMIINAYAYAGVTFMITAFVGLLVWNALDERGRKIEAEATTAKELVTGEAEGMG